MWFVQALLKVKRAEVSRALSGLSVASGGLPPQILGFDASHKASLSALDAPRPGECGIKSQPSFPVVGAPKSTVLAKQGPINVDTTTSGAI